MSGTSTLLSIIYGQGSSGSGGSTDPLPALQLAEKNETKDVAATLKEPTVERDITKFTAAVNSATSVSELLGNKDFLQVFLTANNLADQMPYTALVKKALLSDPSQSNSLANTLSDTNYKSTATAYNFFQNGLSAVQSTQEIATLVNAYAEVTWRNSLDKTTPGLSNALAFRANASTYTTVDQILGDPTARTVVTTAYNIPQQIAFQPLNAQEKYITNNLDISKLQDPKFVDQLTQRYLINAQGSTSSSSSSSGSTTDLTALAVQYQGLIA
jgi:hypothetical protein